jgi:hypothetical protein
MNRVFRVMVLSLTIVATALAQHVVILTAGAQIHGRYEGGNADTVSFLDEHGDRHKFNSAEIQSVVFNGPLPPAPATYSSSGPGGPEPTFAERGYADSDVTPAAGWTRNAVIPAGTEIVIRTIDPIEVRHADARQHFLASVESDVTDSIGRIAIPRGSPAHLIVHDVGGGQIAVDLRSVNVHGARYILNTENITNTRVPEGPGLNKQTGTFVGGTALLGTVLGAVAGGGKGAAIGALAGGAAGAGAQVLTRGNALQIPPETVLRFRLDHDVYLYH